MQIKQPLPWKWAVSFLHSEERPQVPLHSTALQHLMPRSVLTSHPRCNTFCLELLFVQYCLGLLSSLICWSLCKASHFCVICDHIAWSNRFYRVISISRFCIICELAQFTVLCWSNLWKCWSNLWKCWRAQDLRSSPVEPC